jgi:hypothetical protein
MTYPDGDRAQMESGKRGRAEEKRVMRRGKREGGGLWKEEEEEGRRKKAHTHTKRDQFLNERQNTKHKGSAVCLSRGLGV